jgi:hypothetical protein
MSLRILGSAMGAGLFVLASVTLITVTLAQNAPQTAATSNLKLAQATMPPGSPDTLAKPAKSKPKKPKSSQGSGNNGAAAVSGQPAPHVGPPDPGKY